MTMYDFSGAVTSLKYWGKVVRSYKGRPSDTYLARIPENRRNTVADQWHLEIQPLAPFRYEDPNGVRQRSVNLPTPGMPVRANSAVMARVNAFKALGIVMNTEADFGLAEGHIFYFSEEEAGEGQGKITTDIPKVMMDDFVPPADVAVIPTRDDSNGGGGVSAGMSGDPWKAAAQALNGKKTTKSMVMQAVVGSGQPIISNNQEIMVACQQGKLVDLLVEKGLGTVAGDVFTAVA